MLTEAVRDVPATAAIFGFFASGWFGWAQEHPPATWRPWLLTGSVTALLTMVAGAVLTWLNRDATTAFDEDTSRSFGIVVGLEVLLAGAGAVVLHVRGRRDLVPVWIALVVGLHLFPVAALLEFPLIYLVGALVTIAALVAVPVARSRARPVSAVNGLGVGGVLLTAALVCLVAAL
ncbi:hypothetical protein [Paractinoplanes hotanensis]|uniref:Uncharacterized protein n=1 Tax=Paractinoplanes hotanensis TaxID=2906497 RepID=A0ABT0Y6H3_9ACTN|nr:hypothetical protein [Actinoplanes hotanensis]MCM4081077.1 hypothetical protein [Actinoplanes hotanensis]